MNDQLSNEPDDQIPDDSGISTGGSLKAGHLIVIAVVTIAIVAGVIYMRQRGGTSRIPVAGPDRVVEVPEGTRAVTLYFADRDGENLVTETRLVAIGKRYDAQVEQVVSALLNGPQLGGVNTIAVGTQLLAVFFDADDSTLYLDFSSEIVAGHPGGSSAEYFTIAAILRTVSENFPEVRAVQLLIEGLQVGTLAGHIDAYKPFLVRDWR